MDDHEYARQLLGILTRPADPDVPPRRRGDDWIDRGDGFGTVVRVVSVNVVPGEHGSQIEVGFVLHLPEHVDGPSDGTLLLPLDEEWRELSGLGEPEDYAPRVASTVMHTAYRQVRDHGRAPRRTYVPPARDAQHAMLLYVLARNGEVEEQASDRYVLRRPDRDDLVVILTAEQWEQVLQRHGPPQDGSFDYYEELLTASEGPERFLVFWDGDLSFSTREKLPPATAPHPSIREVRRRLAEAEATGTRFGWFAYPPDDEDDELPG